MAQINNVFWSTLTKKVATERADRIERLAKGKFVGNAEGYARAVGFTEGLDYFIEQAEQILKSGEEEEDD